MTPPARQQIRVDSSVWALTIGSTGDTPSPVDDNLMARFVVLSVHDADDYEPPPWEPNPIAARAVPPGTDDVDDDMPALMVINNWPVYRIAPHAVSCFP
jgi:hypothetical protein